MAAPICLALGIQIETGRTITESVLRIGNTVSVTGTLLYDSNGYSIVPEFIMPYSSDAISYLFSRHLVKYALFQCIFFGIAYYCKKKAREIENERKKKYKVINASANYQCIICGNRCEILFNPCLDVCCCKKCASSLVECPKCKRNIVLKIQIHLS